jgi:hypothetical protein
MQLEPDPELLRVLEDSQRSEAKQRPYPRRALGRGTMALLIILRLYVICALPLVAYSFIHALSGGH